MPSCTSSGSLSTIWSYVDEDSGGLGNENYKDEMTKEDDFPFTFIQLDFVWFDKVWMIVNGYLRAKFCGSESVLKKYWIALFNERSILFIWCLMS